MKLVSRDVGLVLATIMVVLAPLVFGGLYVYQKHKWVQQNLARIEPRYARLVGLEQQKEEIDQAREQVLKAQTQYVYPAAMEASQAGNGALKRVQEIFTAAGMQISSSQVVQPKDEKGYDRITLNVQAEGELVALQGVLAVLGSQTPIIIVDTLNIQVAGGLNVPNPKQLPVRLNTQFALSVLKDRT